MLYGPEVPIPPAPEPIRVCAICGGTRMLADDIPCPVCEEDVP